MSRPITKGATNQSTVVRIVDSTDGTPETGVTSATAGLALFYRREGALRVALTALNDLADAAAAHNDGGLAHIGDGYYRVDPQDLAFASGVSGVLIEGTATNMVVIGAYHQLVDLNLDSQSAIDLKDFADDGYDPSTNKVQGVVLVDTLTTYTGNTVQTGDAFARLGAPAGVSVSADVAAVKVDTAATLVDTAEIGTAGAGLTNLGGMSTTMKAQVNTEVVDTLNTDTYAELASVPAATTTLRNMLQWLFMLGRNKMTQTATTKTLLADDTTTSVATSTVSDDGTTFTDGEMT